LQPFTFDLRDQSLCRISRVASADHRRVALRRLTRLANDLVSHEFWATARLSWHVSVRGHITSDAACPIGLCPAVLDGRACCTRWIGRPYRSHRTASASTVAVALARNVRRRAVHRDWLSTFRGTGDDDRILGILPLVTAAAATVFAHERPSPGFWLASVLGALIVVTFMLRRNGGMTFSAGDLFLLGAVLSGALGYTFSGRLATLMPGWEVISWQVVIFLPLAAAATFVLWPADIATAPISSWIGLGYVGLVSQYTAFFVFNAGLAIGGIARVGQVMLLQPFMIVALALPVNGEAIDVETILFAAAVVATVLIGQRMRVTRHRDESRKT